MAGPDSNSKFAMLLIALSFFLLVTVMAYPTEEILAENSGASYQLPDVIKFQQTEADQINQIHKPKSCFHFYVSRNMSSLLSDATKMLQQVRDRREREWILTFIYRIKSLAEHLRTHPDSRNYDCLSDEDEAKRRNAVLNDPSRNPQQELYFVDDAWPNPLQKRTNNPQVNSEKDNNLQEAQSDLSEPHKIADNQNSHPYSTGAWHEELMSNMNSEKKDNSASEQPPSSSVESTSNKKEALVDSIPTASAAIHQELNQQENGEEYPGVGSSPMNAGKTEVQSTDRISEDSSFAEEQPYENGIVLSSPPDCKSNIECEEALNRHISYSRRNGGSSSSTPESDDLVKQLQARQHEENMEYDRLQQQVLKKRIRKALLEEMAPEVKKLRTVGGSEDDLINLWKQSEYELRKSTEDRHDGEFDYEEIGAAAGDLSSSDSYTTNDHTVAPSLGQMQNFKRQSNSGSGTKAYEPYDDSDVLVKQLFDIRFEAAHSKTTKSLSDQREEYLITSTHVPY